MKENGSESRILKREFIIDQSDPRMVEFRESYGEFKPGCKRKTIRLEITEYAPGAGHHKVTTKFGYYEGEPPMHIDGYSASSWKVNGRAERLPVRSDD